MVKLKGVDFNTRFNFGEEFGAVVFLHETDKPAYQCKRNRKSYDLPDEMTDRELQKIMEKCLADNQDYLFDIVKDNEIKIDYKPGYTYG